MKEKIPFIGALSLILVILCQGCKEVNESQNIDSEGWYSLFNGKNLTGWTPNENPETFQVQDGYIIAEGDRSHLFYTGDINDAVFRNFELKIELLTHFQANSGIYFHTKWQDEGWPEYGHEIQVNCSHVGADDYRELKKAGSLYGLRNVYKSFVEDSTWYETHIKVQGKHVEVWIDGLKTVDYWEPTNPEETGIGEKKILSEGAIALQGHDPESRVLIRSIRIKPLPETDNNDPSAHEYPDLYRKMVQKQSDQFAFIDLHVDKPQGGINQLVKLTYQYGLNLGILQDLDEGMTPRSITNQPVFNGIMVTPKSDMNQLEMSEVGFDYIIGDVQQSGFSDILDLIKSGRIQILSHYSEDLNFSQKLHLIEAAVQAGVAFEIDNKKKYPSFDFIREARDRGAQFSMANLVEDGTLAVNPYIIQVIDSCTLNYKDFYIPGW